MSCSAWEIHPVGAFSSVGADIALGKALECHLVLLPAEVPEDLVSYGLKEFFYRCSMWSQHWHYTQDGWSLPWRLGGGLKAFFLLVVDGGSYGSGGILLEEDRVLLWGLCARSVWGEQCCRYPGKAL